MSIREVGIVSTQTVSPNDAESFWRGWAGTDPYSGETLPHITLDKGWRLAWLDTDNNRATGEKLGLVFEIKDKGYQIIFELNAGNTETPVSLKQVLFDARLYDGTLPMWFEVMPTLDVTQYFQSYSDFPRDLAIQFNKITLPDGSVRPLIGSGQLDSYLNSLINAHADETVVHKYLFPGHQDTVALLQSRGFRFFEDYFMDMFRNIQSQMEETFSRN